MEMVGYNMLFTFNGKSIAGETDSNLALSAIVKESLYKSDKGAKRKEVTGHDGTFAINGAAIINEDGSATELDADDLIDMALKTGPDSIFEFVYKRDKGQTYKGNMIITGYTETPNADSNVTYALNCSLSGKLIPVSE